MLTHETVPVEPLIWSQLNSLGIETFIRRDDRLRYSGNKYYKLLLCVEQALEQGKTTLVSCGGAFSNHIHALAQLGYDLKIPTIGIIRGFRPKSLSPTLHDAERWGMQLLFAKPSIYRQAPWSLIPCELRASCYFIPEGGACLLGVKGASLIGEHTARVFEGAYSVCMPVATGTTMAGVIAGLPSNIPCIGINVLKGQDQISSTIHRWLEAVSCRNSCWRVISGYHGGGYAKLNDELVYFIHQFEAQTGVTTDPVYTAKMFYAVSHLAKRGYWPVGTRLLFVHTGGLQGRRGFAKALA